MNFINRNKRLIAIAAISLASFALAGCEHSVANNEIRVNTNTAMLAQSNKVPTPTSLVPDERMAQQVSNALKAAGEAPVRIEVKCDTVALTGEVKSLVDRMRLVQAAASVPNVKAVVSFIDVQPAQRKDAEIENEIDAALAANPITREINPIVSVYQGDVMVGGSVANWPTERLALWLAESVRGVREIENTMYYPADLLADGDTRQAIADRLTAGRLDTKNISIEVSDGRVVLSGRIPSLAAKCHVVTAAYVDGVQTVDSRGLLVDSAPVINQTTLSDSEISRAVEVAFAHRPIAGYQTLRLLLVKNGTVTLIGSVDDLKTKHMAELLALATPGVKTVQNNLSISNDRRRSDLELKETLRNTYLCDPSVDLYQIQVSINQGRVLLHGTVNTMHQKWSAEDIAMSIPGILAINNQLAVRGISEPEVNMHPIFRSSEFAQYWRDMIPERTLKTNDALSAAVKNQLYWNPFIDFRTIAVTVDSGLVIITGKARSEAEKKAAEDGAYQAGAMVVKNRIEVVGLKTSVAAPS